MPTLQQLAVYAFFYITLSGCANTANNRNGATPNNPSATSTGSSTHYFESKVIDQHLRDSIGKNHFIKLSAGYTFIDTTLTTDKEIIVLVHGYSVPSYIWDSTYLAAKKKGFGVIRYDMFGRGYSDRPETVYSVEFLSTQLEELLDKLAPETAVNLVGLSCGGRVVSYYTATHPARVKKLVLVDPSGFETVDKKDNKPVKLCDREVAKALREKAPHMADSQLEDFYKPERFAYWPDLYRPQMEYKGFVHALLSTKANMRDLHPEMGQIGNSGIPVLLLMGKHDTVIYPEKTIPEAQRLIPQIEVVKVVEAGHLPHLENSRGFNKAFFQFLTEQIN